jgi:hypothetical protein
VRGKPAAIRRSGTPEKIQASVGGPRGCAAAQENSGDGAW